MENNNEEEKIISNKQFKTSKKRNIVQPILLRSHIISVTILEHLIDDLTKYSIQAIPKEAIGLLGGKEVRPHEILVSKLLFVTIGDENSVSFAEEDFKSFEIVLEEGIYCIGWWHSHPGYGLFLSKTDITTHLYSFQLHNVNSIALVVEPTIIDKNGRAAIRCYQVIGEQDKVPFKYKEIAVILGEK